MAFFLISLLFFLVSFGFSSSSMVSREVFPMEGNIAWVVQVSDLHISAYHHDRAEDLDRLLGPALRIIRPHLLLITGDITDAKNRKRTSTRQDESEWIQYKRSMDAVVRQGGIEKRRIFDIRGNHDKYGVPYAGSSLDFFSSYSISSQLNRLSNIHSISLVVFVLDSQGKETQSALRPFSVEGKVAAEYPTTLLVHLVFRIRWEALYSILLWGNLCFLFIFLSLPKLLNQFMDRSVSYQKWAASVSVSSPVQQRRVLFSVLWVLIEGSRNKALWCCMVFYLLWLVRLPWFWGHMTSENGDIATMYIFGWSVNSPYTMNLMGLGNPDVLTITLPFMYFVVTPLMLLIYGLCAERSAACFQASARKTVESEQRVAKTMRTKRRVLLLACAIFTCIHFKQCCSLMRFYGAGTVALSPAFSWAPPLLLATAIYSTS